VHKNSGLVLDAASGIKSGSQLTLQKEKRVATQLFNFYFDKIRVGLTEFAIVSKGGDKEGATLQLIEINSAQTWGETSKGAILSRKTGLAFGVSVSSISEGTPVVLETRASETD